MSDTPTVRDSTGRFVKGHPGGPGRPPNPINIVAEQLDRLGVEFAQEVMNAIIDRARSGNLKAAEMVLQRIWPVRRARPMNMGLQYGTPLPSTLAEHVVVAEAMLTGDITPQDAQAAARVLRALDDQMRAAEPLMRRHPPENGESG